MEKDLKPKSFAERMRDALPIFLSISVMFVMFVGLVDADRFYQRVILAFLGMIVMVLFNIAEGLNIVLKYFSLAIDILLYLMKKEIEAKKEEARKKGAMPSQYCPERGKGPERFTKIKINTDGKGY